MPPAVRVSDLSTFRPSGERGRTAPTAHVPKERRHASPSTVPQSPSGPFGPPARSAVLAAGPAHAAPAAAHPLSTRGRPVRMAPLTERLLYAAGVIDELGSVDQGSARTDSLALERRRGITIKSAVMSFTIDDVTVNLIDTPGHPEFIAEVERVLSVLDGAVLVVSAVEGVQAQTRVLMRALQRLRVPTLIFVNKIDRRGARDERAVRSVAEKLTPANVPMGSVRGRGTRGARFASYRATDGEFGSRLVEVLAEHDDALPAAYVDDDAPPRDLRRELAVQSRRALVHPLYFGSAITGAGVDALSAGIGALLPATEGDVDGPVSGTVFKVERGPAGERLA